MITTVEVHRETDGQIALHICRVEPGSTESLIGLVLPADGTYVVSVTHMLDGVTTTVAPLSRLKDPDDTEHLETHERQRAAFTAMLRLMAQVLPQYPRLSGTLNEHWVLTGAIRDALKSDAHPFRLCDPLVQRKEEEDDDDPPAA